MKSATRYLERKMVVDIARVTEGRYRRVQVDDKTLDIRVHAPERGDWVDVTSLSQGTLDLVYLVARIGLVRLVTGDRRPPLILDDPFITFDDARAKRSLELLRDVARDFQVIYLTTSDRYDASADAVVPLAGPTELDDMTDEADVAGARRPRRSRPTADVGRRGPRGRRLRPALRRSRSGRATSAAAGRAGGRRCSVSRSSWRSLAWPPR